MLPSQVVSMSSPVPDADNENDKVHIVLWGRQENGHPSVNSCLTSSEKLNSVDGSEDNVNYIQVNTPRISEKKLANGDLYVGSWRGNLPDGKGKYLWTDCCTYEGQWVNGKKTGRGKILWPSGSTYEGEFLGGFMHGVGTYTSVDGTVYKGDWSVNIQHGLGRKWYANKDVYEGSWKQGLRDGPGRYTWDNGNVYMGDWKGGVMCGKGTLTWASGDLFAGQWLDGLEHGHGVYMWADGGCYIGTWSRGIKDGKGTFYPAGTRPPEILWIRRRLCMGNVLDDVTEKRLSHRLSSASSADVDQLLMSTPHKLILASPSENLPNGNFLRKSESLLSRSTVFERRQSLESSLERVLGLDSGNAGTVARRLILKDDENDLKARLPSVEREYAQGVLISELVNDGLMPLPSKNARRRMQREAKEMKKPGEVIIKGHRSYDLMLSLQLGIRYTVGKITQESKRDIKPCDFGHGARIWMKFPKKGSQLTPCHHSFDFKWKDYCPMVFRSLRELFKIDAADYMISICGNDALRELSSPGKSGSIFFLSHDDCFMIKALRTSEVQVLLRMLPNYYEHVSKYENTLVTKFFGLHQVKPASGSKVQFVVMGNVFCTALRIHRRFDLKGSSQGRSTENVEIDETTTLKDLDLDFVFHLEPTWRQTLLKQVELDCGFLRSQKIMDYSLLLGIHFRAPQYAILSAEQLLPESDETLPYNEALDIEDWTYPRGLVLAVHEPNDGTSLGPHVRGTPLRAAAAGHEEVDLLLPGIARLQVQLGVSMPARADHIPREITIDSNHRGKMFDNVYDVVLYFGIIDILQKYTISKRIEHAYKSLQFDSVSISAVAPHYYSKRFQEFMRKIFPANLY